MFFMMRSFLIALAISLGSVDLFSQTITTSSIAGSPFCANFSFDVSYTASGAFNGDNIFTAQLSDENGNFGSPKAIGSFLSSSSGIINVTIPASQGGGSFYKIRVVGSSPIVIGSANPEVLTINPLSISTPLFSGTTFCAFQDLNIDYSILNFCGFPNTPLNYFSAQLSDGTGSFANPIVIGTTQNILSGTINAIIPANTVDGNAYRIRIVSSNPGTGLISPTNSVNLTINALGINAPILNGNSFCQGEPLAITYNVKNGCAFDFFSNTFTAQLSDASGSFASPTSIGFVSSNNSGVINATIPNGTPAGSAYKIRVISSSPSVIASPTNGQNITISSPSGDPSVFGSNAWNVFAYAGTASPISSNTYLGTYTETKLSFDTKDRWITSAGPSTANASSGLAYTGCPVNRGQYSLSFKRTNFTCGYYQIDVPLQDEALTLFVNGAKVFQNNQYTDVLQSNVWTGFLGASSTVELQLTNAFADGQLQVTFINAPSPLLISDPPTICSTATTTLKVSSPLSLSYAWTPLTNLTPSNGIGATVIAAPTATAIYTATGTDSSTGCSVSSSVTVTVVSPSTGPAISVSSIPSTICSGSTSSTLKASGANTYTWAPATGLSSTSGNVVIANPASATIYTVTGTTGCQSASTSATVSVQPTPSTPSSVFGNGTWNVYCHNNTTLSDYYGYYTENNLSIKTTSRWANNSGPSVANSSSGLPYAGCTINNSKYSMSFKRANFNCDYYQIDIPYQDDGVKLLINGVEVFQNNNLTPNPQTNIWTGFLYASSTVEIQFVNNQFAGELEVSIARSPAVPQTINSNVTICPGSSADLTATSSIAGATYTWFVSDPSATITFFPNPTVPNPQLKTTASTPISNYLVTNIMTDAAGTGCTTSKDMTISVSNAPPTVTLSPSSATSFVTDCTNVGVILTASGANTYSWSPSDGLSSTTGFSVLAKPLGTKTYTVIGDNNCSTNSATATITVSSVPPSTFYPSGTWNVYGFNSIDVGQNYQGFYTENGSGVSGLNFDTRTRWNIYEIPSNTNAYNGKAWEGCPLSSQGSSLSFKRTGFACGLYQIDVSHSDGFILFINNVRVGGDNSSGDNHPGIWTGVLDASSKVEWQLLKSRSRTYLQADFKLIAPLTDQTIWTGRTNNDWFNSTNWCNGVPTSALDALIPAAGPPNMPVINATGAVVKNVVINAAIPSGLFTAAIPAASLTMNTFNLDVHGSWTNNGTFTPNSGTVSFVGTRSGNTISTSSTETFKNLLINNSNGITISSGVHLISGVLTLTNGIVNQKGSLKILRGANVSGVTNSSFIDGVVSKAGNTAFTFPVGKGNVYRPISISAPSAFTDEFSAQYFNVNPNGKYPIAQHAATLDKISSAEYWVLDRTAGSSNVNVTLSLGSNSEVVTSFVSLKVAAWNGSLWTDQGNGGTSGTFTAGTLITGAASTVYGPFTFNDKLTVGLEDTPVKGEISVYPNPAINHAYISLNGAVLNSVSITNNIGQEINCKYSVESSKLEIDTSPLIAGLYIVNLNADQKSYKLKLLIQR
jgi:Secretion system C-terminal sorting domain